MIFYHDSVKIEDSMPYIAALTFVGGFVNAYSFFLRGGAFVSMQSGNMIRIGIAACVNDKDMFLSSIIPIMGCLIGVVIAHITRYKFFDKPQALWQEFSLICESIVFFAVGFVPLGICDNYVNVVMALASGFQLCNYRFYQGAMHNTTIASGNVRNLGQFIGDAIINHDAYSVIKTLKYFFTMAAFGVGAFVGAYLSPLFGQYSIWACTAILLSLLFWICLDSYKKAKATQKTAL